MSGSGNPEVLIYIAIFFLLVYIFSIRPQEKRDKILAEEQEIERQKKSKQFQIEQKEKWVKKKRECDRDPVCSLLRKLSEKKHKKTNTLTKLEEDILEKDSTVKQIEWNIGRLQRDGPEHFFLTLDEDTNPVIVTTDRRDYYRYIKILQELLYKEKKEFSRLINLYNEKKNR